MTSLPTPRTLNKSLAASLMAASLEDPEPDPKAPDTSRASQRPGTGRLPGVRTSGGKVKLRDLDPHLEVLEAKPPSQQPCSSANSMPKRTGVMKMRCELCTVASSRFLSSPSRAYYVHWSRRQRHLKFQRIMSDSGYKRQ